KFARKSALPLAETASLFPRSQSRHRALPSETGNPQDEHLPILPVSMETAANNGSSSWSISVCDNAGSDFARSTTGGGSGLAPAMASIFDSPCGKLVVVCDAASALTSTIVTSADGGA